MSNTNDQERKKEKEKTKRLKEFYNYKHWREIQRNQLTISSNIFFYFKCCFSWLFSESFNRTQI